MVFGGSKNEFSNVGIDGNGNSIDVAETINKTYITNNPPPIPNYIKMSIIQQILQGILELDSHSEIIELDVQSFSIEEKIDYNKIIAYKEAYEIYMEDKILIEQRLKFLEINENPLASTNLYRFIKRIYAKHCRHKDPDMIIQHMCNEIKSDLSVDPNINCDDIALIPAIIFYVFTKCHIFKKPAMQTC